MVSAGNPVEVKLKNEYTLKGVGMSQTIDSVVRIHVGPDDRIEKVEDRWNDKLPEGAVAEVCVPVSLRRVVE